MFYITTHTITQNQFADKFVEHEFPNIDPQVCTIPFGPYGLTTADEKKSPVFLQPNNLYTIEEGIDQSKLAQKCDDLHTIIVANGLRSHTTSVCSTKSLLSTSDSGQGASYDGQTILVIMMAVIFALLLFTLITLVFIKIVS